MMLRVDPESAVPVYEQLREQISTMVATRSMAPGTQLPTIRQLAADLGVAKGTISKVYDELLRGGIVISDGRRGTRVADDPGTHLDGDAVSKQLDGAAEHYAVVVSHLGVDDDRALGAIEEALRAVRTAR
jgi:GntR family transcriptional regulator